MTAPTPRATHVSAIVEYISGHGIEYEVIEHEPVYDAGGEARTLHRQLDTVAKTVVLQDGAAYVLVVLPGSERVDLTKVRTLLGATGHLRLATEAEMARDFPDIEVGATPPIGPMLPTAEIVDQRLLEEARVVCAGGDHRHSIVLDPREIVRVTDARVADICADE